MADSKKLFTIFFRTKIVIFKFQVFDRNLDFVFAKLLSEKREEK